MLVIDLPHIESSSRARRVAVIGSCRVRDPAKILVRRREAVLVWEMPVLTHTVTEAIQSLSYVGGKIDIPAAYVPFTFFSDVQPHRDAQPPELLKSIDAFVIEISDLKHIRLNEFYFQQNYFKQNFLSPNAAALLAWFREFSLKRVPSDSIIETTVSQLEKSGFGVTDEILTLLRESRLEELGADDLLSALDTLMFDKSKEWILVSHFVVPNEKSPIMEDRRRLSESLRRVTNDLGVKLFDPSSFFAAYDRKEILDDNGVNFFEYSPDFREVVATSLTTEILAHDKRRPVSSGQVDWSVVKAAGDRVNSMLVACHSDRVALLGVDGSGLYQHYKSMLDLRCFVQDWQIDVALLVINFLHRFDQYCVTSAGLGELAFPLAACGLKVVALQHVDRRLDALLTGLEYVRSRDPEAAARCEAVRGNLVSMPHSASDGMLVAVDALVSDHADGDPTIAQNLKMFEALLVNPRLFLRVRETKSEQDEAISFIENSGFRLKARYMAPLLAYFEKI